MVYPPPISTRARCKGVWLRRCLIAGCVLWFAGIAQASTQLTVGAGTGTYGTTVLIPVTINSTEGVVAAQFELRFDPRLVSTGALAGDALADHLVASNESTSGVRRVVIYSLNRTPLKNGVLVTIPFSVEPGSEDGAHALTVTNLLLVGTGGGGVTAANIAPGTLTVITPPRFDPLVREHDGRIHLHIMVAPDQVYLIEFSPDLRQWLPFSTNPAPLGLLILTDAGATNVDRRFYRAFRR